MARKERNDIDYFPHPVNHGKKMFYLRDKFNNDGYAVWFMLLEQLGKSNYHYLDLKDDIQLMYLSSEFKVDESLLIEIINVLVKFNEFDNQLWENERILFNEKFIENISDAYKKRNNECVNKNSLLLLLTSKGRLKPPKSNPKPSKCILKGDGSTQTKLKDSILKDSKEEKDSDEIKNFTHSILKYFPVKPNKIESWYKITDELTRIDSYSFQEIELIVNYFTKDNFWSKNFQSYTKLRTLNKEGIKYIDYFKNILIAEKNGKNRQNNSGKKGATLEEIREIASKHFD